MRKTGEQRLYEAKVKVDNLVDSARSMAANGVPITTYSSSLVNEAYIIARQYGLYDRIETIKHLRMLQRSDAGKTLTHTSARVNASGTTAFNALFNN